MTTKNIVFKNSDINRLLFVFSLIVAFECILGMINFYRFIVTGIIFEVLWLPAIAFAIGVPLAALFYLFRDKFNTRSLNYYSILIIGIAVVVMALGH
jgi:hypothetical protein